VATPAVVQLSCGSVRHMSAIVDTGRRLTAGASRKHRATNNEPDRPDPGYWFLLGDWGFEVSEHDHSVDGICVFGVRVG
jgi:hypothetical protein